MDDEPTEDSPVQQEPGNVSAAEHGSASQQPPMVWLPGEHDLQSQRAIPLVTAAPVREPGEIPTTDMSAQGVHTRHIGVEPPSCKQNKAPSHSHVWPIVNLKQWLVCQDTISFALAAVYVCGVTYLLLLGGQEVHPFIIPDEAQYVMVGLNLAQLHAFEFRGGFPLLIPPLYPLLVALAKLLAHGGSFTAAGLFVNAVVMAAVVFPAYGFARILGIGKIGSLAAAGAAMLIPDMYFINHFMAENLYYPLFMAGCLAAAWYLQGPSIKRGFTFGITAGLTILTKNTGMALIAAWAIVAIVPILFRIPIWIREWVREPQHQVLTERVRAQVAPPSAALIALILVYGPYEVARLIAVHSVRCSNCAVGELSDWSHIGYNLSSMINLWIEYGAALFIGVGVIAFIPFLAFVIISMRSSGTQRRIALFCALLVASVTIMAATYSGLQSGGQLIERHLFVVVPVVLICAARGLALVCGTHRYHWLFVAVLVAIPLSLLSSLALIPSLAQVQPGPFFGSPSIYSFGNLASGGLFGSSMDWTLPTFLKAATLAAVGLQFLWLIKPSRRTVVFLLFVCVLFAFEVRSELRQYNTYVVQAQISPNLEQGVGWGQPVNWLEGQVPTGKTILVLGQGLNLSTNPYMDAKPDPQLSQANRVLAPHDTLVYYFEAVGHYDIRMVPQLALLPDVEQQTGARFLLSPLDLNDLPLISHFGQMRLYDLAGTDPHSLGAISYNTHPDFYKAAVTNVHVPLVLAPNSRQLASVTIENHSHSTWYRNGSDAIAISYHWLTPYGEVRVYQGEKSLLPRDIGPGQSISMNFTIDAPSPGRYLLVVDLEQLQGSGFFEQQGGKVGKVTVTVGS